MKAPRLRVLAITAATAAMATGLSAGVASAATAHAASSVIAAAPAASPVHITDTVTGTFTNADGQGTFAGTFMPKKFSVANGVLEATGLLKGTMTDANGTKLGTVSRTVTMPVNTSASSGAAQASGAKANATTQQAALACNVLDLVLGPLNLNLLGLVVTLNQVHLNITAVPGAGNLLGNLLCAVAGLLNGGGALSGLLGQIATLLNQILAAL